MSVYDETGVNIEHAVICVPANSNPIKIRAVNDAAELAGFRSHSLVLEPIAVGLAYGLQKTNGIWMIYDLGGGTFNVSIIANSKGELEKIATDGLDNIGGNSFDWKIVNDAIMNRAMFVAPSGEIVAAKSSKGTHDRFPEDLILYVSGLPENEEPTDPFYFEQVTYDLLRDLTRLKGWIRLNGGSNAVEERCYAVLTDWNEVVLIQ